MRDDFAIFICTHGRPDKQLTLDTLKRTGYTGKWYLVLDDTDETIQSYIDNFDTNNIIVFNKNHYINCEKYDNGDNKLHDKCIVYAKRAVEDIAKFLGCKYFVIADDDVSSLSIRVPIDGKLRNVVINNLDDILEAHIKLFSNNVATIGFGITYYYFGGVSTFSYDNLSKRFLPYQFIIRNSAVEVNWLSWFAEDDVTGFQSSMIGNVWLISLYVMMRCANVGDVTLNGGMVEIYRESPDKYNLNFNVVKYCPDRILLKFNKKTGTFELIKHMHNCFPKILNGRYKK